MILGKVTFYDVILPHSTIQLSYWLTKYQISARIFYWLKRDGGGGGARTCQAVVVTTTTHHLQVVCGSDGPDPLSRHPGGADPLAER